MIFNEITNNIYSRYGKLFSKKENGELRPVNQRCLAALFKASGYFLYVSSEKHFEVYDDITGLWKTIADEVLLEQIGEFAFRCGSEEGYSEHGVLLTQSVLSAVLRLLKGMVSVPDFPKCAKYHIHLKNGVLEYNTFKHCFELKNFAPEYYSHNRIEFSFRQEYLRTPEQFCKRFLNDLLYPMMHPDCLKTLQQYIGQCLIKINLSQTFLIISGEAGAGKSVLVNIIEKLLGNENVIEFHPDRLGSPYEISSYRDKSLLTAKDIEDTELNENKICAIKKLTGKDRLTSELKHANERVYVEGTFNLIVTGNGHILLNYGNNRDAFERRLLWIPIKKPKDRPRINNFDDILLKEEAEGILMWAIRGAEELLENDGQIYKSAKIETGIRYLLDESKAVETFVEVCITPQTDQFFTTEDAVSAFYAFADRRHWHNLPTQKKIEREIHQSMIKFYRKAKITASIHNTTKRGYLGYKIEMPEQKSGIDG